MEDEDWRDAGDKKEKREIKREWERKGEKERRK